MSSITLAGLYSVNLWGSHPNDGNDDCWIGSEYATKEEALAAYNGRASLVVEIDGYDVSDVAFIELDGPGIYKIRSNPDYRGGAPSDDDGEWRREIAMQAGMMGGCEAYNDEMGY